jgi:hypothetical protein
MRRTFVIATICAFTALSLVVTPAKAGDSMATRGGGEGLSKLDQILDRYLRESAVERTFKPTGSEKTSTPDPSRYRVLPSGNVGGGRATR